MTNSPETTAAQPFQLAFTPQSTDRALILKQAEDALNEHARKSTLLHLDHALTKKLSQELNLGGRVIDLSTKYVVRDQAEADERHSIALSRLQPVIDAIQSAGKVVDTGSAVYIDAFEHGRKDELDARRHRQELEWRLERAYEKGDPRAADYNVTYNLERDVHLALMRSTLASGVQLVEYDPYRMVAGDGGQRKEKFWSLAPERERMTPPELQSAYVQLSRKSQQVTLPGNSVSLEADMAGYEAGNIAALYHKKTGSDPVAYAGRPSERALEQTMQIIHMYAPSVSSVETVRAAPVAPVQQAQPVSTPGMG